MCNIIVTCKNLILIVEYASINRKIPFRVIHLKKYIISDFEEGVSLNTVPRTLKSDDIPMKFIYITVGLAAALPEYLAPILTLACFLVFKKHFSLTSQKVKMGDVGKVFLLFMCYSFISCIWSQTHIYSGAISLLWMGMLLGSFFISNMATTRARFENLVVCLSLGGGVVGGISLIEYVLLLAGVKIPNPLWQLLDNAIYAILPFDIYPTAHVWSTTRASATFDNPLICATYLIMVFPIAVYGFMSAKKKNRRICGVCALLIIGGVLGTTSRGAAVAIVASLAVLLFINSKKIVPVLVTLVGAVSAFAVVILKRNAIFAQDFALSTDSRIKMWKAIIDLIKKYPLFGYGAGCVNTRREFLAYKVHKPHAHNLFFEITAELGIIGLIFFMVVMALILKDIIILIRTGGIYKRMGVAFLSVMAGFFVISLVEFTLQTPKELQYFMIVLGMLEAAKRLALAEKSKEQALTEQKT